MLFCFVLQLQTAGDFLRAGRLMCLWVSLKSIDHFYLILSSLAVALYDFFLYDLLSNDFEWFIVESCPQHHLDLIFFIIRSIPQKLLQRSCGSQRVTIILHYAPAVLHTCPCLNALHLMSCLLAHRSLEGAMVAITSPAELPEQHPTQCLYPDLSFFLGLWSSRTSGSSHLFCLMLSG